MDHPYNEENKNRVRIDIDIIINDTTFTDEQTSKSRCFKKFDTQFSPLFCASVLQQEGLSERYVNISPHRRKPQMKLYCFL